MAEPTNKFIAVLVDGSGDMVGDPQYFPTQKDAAQGAETMLRTGASGLECYVYDVAAQVTIRTRFEVRKLGNH